MSAIGQGINRTDGRLKVCGLARYAAEFHFPRLAYAALVQSTISKGKVAAIDGAAAEKLPGVLAVLTYKNAPKIRKPPPNPRTCASSLARMLPTVKTSCPASSAMVSAELRCCTESATATARCFTSTSSAIGEGSDASG